MVKILSISLQRVTALTGFKDTEKASDGQVIYRLISKRIWTKLKNGKLIIIALKCAAI